MEKIRRHYNSVYIGSREFEALALGLNFELTPFKGEKHELIFAKSNVAKIFTIKVSAKKKLDEIWPNMLIFILAIKTNNNSFTIKIDPGLKFYFFLKALSLNHDEIYKLFLTRVNQLEIIQ